jgi:hypothetical protein
VPSAPIPIEYNWDGPPYRSRLRTEGRIEIFFCDSKLFYQCYNSTHVYHYTSFKKHQPAHEPTREVVRFFTRLPHLIVLMALTLTRSSVSAAVAERAEILVEKADATVQSDRKDRLSRSVEGRKDKHDTAELDAKFASLKEIKDLSNLTLFDAIRIATKYNRDYAGERDSNSFVALSYIQARHIFDPHLSATLGVLGSNTPAARALQANGTFGVDLATEYSTHLNLALNTSATSNLKPGIDSNVSSALFTLTQPLLRGFGKTVAREPLTQAERNMTYQLRRFELYREDFTIEVERQFYNLLREVCSEQPAAF